MSAYDTSMKTINILVLLSSYLNSETIGVPFATDDTDRLIVAVSIFFSGSKTSAS
jgi:hypothetical protein